MSQIGFRWWALSRLGGLRSTCSKYTWHPDRHQAYHQPSYGDCQQQEVWEPAPAENCKCGFYVWANPAEAYSLPRRLTEYQRKCLVFGAVEWWGHAYPHDEQYFGVELLRVQCAEVRGIVVVSGQVAHYWQDYQMTSATELVERWGSSIQNQQWLRANLSMLPSP
jgi:hypothetical protein